KSFIQLYNVIRHNSLPPWDIGYGDLIVPRAKTYVYLIEFAKLIIRHPGKFDTGNGRFYNGSHLMQMMEEIF
uniref:hypothetical protein n=1 Tax=Dialister invisus TaxID=218538 RepID=UPI003A91C439